MAITNEESNSNSNSVSADRWVLKITKKGKRVSFVGLRPLPDGSRGYDFITPTNPVGTYHGDFKFDDEVEAVAMAGLIEADMPDYEVEVVRLNDGGKQDQAGQL